MTRMPARGVSGTFAAWVANSTPRIWPALSFSVKWTWPADDTVASDTSPSTQRSLRSSAASSRSAMRTAS